MERFVAHFFPEIKCRE